MNFSLWLEFEEVEPDNWDIHNEFANVIVELADGRRYGINVWTFKFFETALSLDREQGATNADLYIKPPDLFVKELSRECIHRTIHDLLQKGNLEDYLNPSIIGRTIEE